MIDEVKLKCDGLEMKRKSFSRNSAGHGLGHDRVPDRVTFRFTWTRLVVFNRVSCCHTRVSILEGLRTCFRVLDSLF